MAIPEPREMSLTDAWDIAPEFDGAHDAFKLGFAAGMNAVPRNQCPFTGESDLQKLRRKAWFAGRTQAIQARRTL